MKIHIHDIPPEGTSVDLGPGSEALEPALRALDEGISVSDLRCHIDLSRAEEVVTVSGSMAGELTVRCSRCLEPVHAPLDERFRFFLRRPLTEEELGEGDEIELSGEALDYAFLEGDTIDIDSLVQEQLLLALPVQPLCRPDCKGICQRCGADLNLEPCQCTDTAVDSRFAVLKQLKVSQKN